MTIKLVVMAPSFALGLFCTQSKDHDHVIMKALDSHSLT